MRSFRRKTKRISPSPEFLPTKIERGAASKRKLILYIHGGNPIDTETAKIAVRCFAEHGYEVTDLSVLDPKAGATLHALLRDRRKDLFFFLSSNFWAINIHDNGRLLHTLTGIPLVILIHDHPGYFLHQLSPSLDGALIFAPSDLAEFITKHYPIAVRTIVNAGFFPPDKDRTRAPAFGEFLARNNALFCPMNLSVHGLNIDDIWERIKALPAARRAHATRLIEAGLTECFTPLHVISENLAVAGNPEIEIEDLMWAFNYIKLWRRTWLVEALAELPICVTSDYVPAELERKHARKFKAPLPMTETLPLYAKYRFVVNSSSTNAIHDRVTEGMFNNAVCITDPNPTIAHYFKNDRDMVFVDYKEKNLAERIARLIENPERAFEMTANSYVIWSQPAFYKGSYRELLDAVEEMWTAADRSPAIS